MNLIERYLFALANHLPKENKEEILKEVEANIHDMLAGDYSEENVIAVLKQLGNPRKLSAEYQTKKRYLIGPEYFNSYIKTLIYVAILVGCIFFFINLFSAIVNSLNEQVTFEIIGTIIGEAIASLFEGAMAAAIWVTIAYVVVEHTEYTFDGKNVVKKSEWSPTLLKEVTNNKKVTYKKSQILVEIFLAIIFTSLFIALARYIGIYREDYTFTALFNIERFKIYAFIMAGMVLYQVFININMYLAKNPNYKIAVMKALYNFLNMVVFLIAINDDKLFNPSFKTEFINITQMSIQQSDQIRTVVVTIILFGILVGSIIDTIKGFYQAYKNQKN